MGMADFFKEDEVQKAYDKYVSNNPWIHSNRYPTWDELLEVEREKWREAVRNGLTCPVGMEYER